MKDSDHYLSHFPDRMSLISRKLMRPASIVARSMSKKAGGRVYVVGVGRAIHFQQKKPVLP